MTKEMTKANDRSALIEALSANSVLRRLVEKAGGDESFAKRFKNELLTVVTTNKYLQNCSAQSILTAAGQAATLKLSISPSLGYAYVIPYKNEATFQIGYKGIIKLAQNTGLYRRINSIEVYEGEIENYNRLTGELEFGKRESDTVVGYIAYFELLNGFRSTLYMTRSEMEAHAEKYSASYKRDKESKWNSSVWSTNFDAMGKKTVLKLLLSKYGPLSIDMQQAIKADQSVVNVDGSYNYVDNYNGKIVDMSTGEVITSPAFTDELATKGLNAQTYSTTAQMETETSNVDNGMPEIDFD